MNKEIKRLAEEALKSVPDDAPSIEHSMAIFNEKFAELIIKECARVADCPSSFRHTTGYKILRHFDIKELA